MDLISLWHRVKAWHITPPPPTTAAPVGDCTICLNPLRILAPPTSTPPAASHPAVALPCGHMLGARCWLDFLCQRDDASLPTCPVCRAPVYHPHCSHTITPLPIPETTAFHMVDSPAFKTLTIPEGGSIADLCDGCVLRRSVTPPRGSLASRSPGWMEDEEFENEIRDASDFTLSDGSEEITQQEAEVDEGSFDVISSRDVNTSPAPSLEFSDPGDNMDLEEDLHGVI
ncbi:hypothetical protein OQA88_10688 [Cercophora sp. LCS_1]